MTHCNSLDFQGECLRAATFANEVSILLHDTKIFGEFVVNGCVLGEIVEPQMLRQSSELIVTERFAQEFRHFVHFSSQILPKPINTNGISCQISLT